MVLSMEVRARATAIADLFLRAHTEAAAEVRTLWADRLLTPNFPMGHRE